VIDGAIKNLNEFYVFPDIAKKMEDSVRAHQKHGDYDAITDGGKLSSKLTDDFQAISHDKHLHVNYSAIKMPERPKDAKPTPEQIAQERKELVQMNCGVLGLVAGAIAYAAKKSLPSENASVFNTKLRRRAIASLAYASSIGTGSRSEKIRYRAGKIVFRRCRAGDRLDRRSSSTLKKSIPFPVTREAKPVALSI